MRRLPNGNTPVNGWGNEWSEKLDHANPPMQAVELTSDKKIVWVLGFGEESDLGPVTTI